MKTPPPAAPTQALDLEAIRAARMKRFGASPSPATPMSRVTYDQIIVLDGDEDASFNISDTEGEEGGGVGGEAYDEEDDDEVIYCGECMVVD